MKIDIHAVENYVIRVLDKALDEATESDYEYAYEQVRLAAREPVTIYHGEKDSCPVHVRNGVAVPVREGDEESVVPTAYKEEVFLRKLDKYEEKEDEPATV